MHCDINFEALYPSPHLSPLFVGSVCVDVGSEISGLCPHLSLRLVGSVHTDVGAPVSALSPHLSLWLVGSVHIDVGAPVSDSFKNDTHKDNFIKLVGTQDTRYYDRP